MKRAKRTTALERATIDDVAQHAGVSTATVSRVVNGSGQVSEQTAERVYDAIRALNYVPHGAARDLARRKTNIVGLIVPSTVTPYYMALFSGIDRGISSAGYSLLVYVNHFRSAGEQLESLVLGEHNTDGLIIFTDSLGDEVIQRLHHRRFPMVLLHRTSPKETDIPCITIENISGARTLLDHLIVNCGRRRIAHVRGLPGNLDTVEREAGYLAALEAHGIAVDPTLIGDGNFSENGTDELINRWLEDGVEFDAIFAADDNSAVGAITALQRVGKRVPDDVAVVGFNDDSMARYLNPPLTTVRSDTEAVGYQAALQIIQCINGIGAESRVRLPTELVIRQSCGYSIT